MSTTTQRNCPYKHLSKQPLALVLAQVRFSPILTIEGYIPKIQDNLRKNGYPVYSQQQNIVFEMPPVDPVNVKQTLITQWRFESPSLDTVIIIDKEQVLFLTSKYTKFEDFIRSFIKVLKFVLQITEHEEFGVVVRLGLRYIDQIRKQSDTDDIDLYLRPELQGMVCSEYANNKKQYSIVSVGSTRPAGNFEGQLVIRVIRGEKGMDIPPDLMPSAPANRKTVAPDEDIAMVDMDHYWVGSMGPDVRITQIIEEMFFRMHDTIINGFHNSVISEDGIKKWQ
jgi:uncharacterized protein (TIGR04255 family)